MKEVTAGAPVLLFHPRAQKAGSPGFEPDLAAHHALLAPLGLLRNHPRLHELPKVASENLVLLGKKASFHVAP